MLSVNIMGREKAYEYQEPADAKPPVRKPVKKETFKHFIWNGDKGEFFGRNGASWGNVIQLKFAVRSRQMIIVLDSTYLISALPEIDDLGLKFYLHSPCICKFM